MSLVVEAESLHVRNYRDSALFVESCAVRLLISEAEAMKNRRQFDSASVMAQNVLNTVSTNYGGNPCFECCAAAHSRAHCRVYAQVLLRLADYQNSAQRFSESELNLQEAITAARGLVDSMTLGDALYTLSNLLAGQERIREQIAVLGELLSLDRAKLGETHIYVAYDYQTLGRVQSAFGMFEEADESFQMAAVIYDSLNADDPKLLSSFHRTQSIHLRRSGRLANAKMAIDRALAITISAASVDSSELAQCYTSLGQLYLEMRLPDEALTAFQKALDIQRLIYQRNHLLIATSSDNLGLAFRDLGRPGEAIGWFTAALEIRRQRTGDSSGVVALSYNNLALALEDLGLYDSALVMYGKSLTLRSRNFGDVNPYTARCLRNIAVVHYKRGDYESAVDAWRGALEITEKSLGRQHAEFADGLALAANAYRSRGDFEVADSLLTSAIEIRLRYLKSCFTILTESQALTSSTLLRSTVRDLCNVELDRRTLSPRTNQQLAEFIVRVKGVVSDEVFLRHRDKRSSVSDSSIAFLIAERRNITLQISRASSVFESSSRNASEKVESLYLELASVDNKLRSLGAADERLSHSGPDLQTLTRELPQATTLIEYYHYDRWLPGDTWSRPQYLAIVLNRQNEVRVVDLGNAAKIDSTVAEMRQHMNLIGQSEHVPTLQDLQRYREIGRRLFSQIWKPILSVAKLEPSILIAPDGALSLVPFAALVDDSNRYLIEVNEIHNLSAGRDLMRLEHVASSNRGLLALGDPDFDAPVTQRIAAQNTAETRIALLRPSEIMPNQRSNCAELDALSVERLPATRNEVVNISESWKSLTGKHSIYRVGASSSEELFRKECIDKEVIYLATHGFYLADDCPSAQKVESRKVEASSVPENPLLRSGLLLAGANLHGKDADSLGFDDGILTADEVSSLNLTGTKLVVLSACETGLGRVEQGEGVYGLRRAFLLAGARTVISALWRVDDKATAEMMSRFFDVGDSSIPSRMRQLQLNQIQRLRDLGLPDHPYTWGAFIATGDWR